MASIRVPNFDPARNGFPYPNYWPSNPIRQFRLGNVATLNIGDAANGLCGGMSFACADLWAKGRTPGDDPQPGSGTPRYEYIVDRQITSFDDGRLPFRFYSLMSPTRPEREPWWAALLGQARVDRHSRTYVMVHEEWPVIRQLLESGQIAMIGLVRVVSRDPMALSHNHQVLAYGYDTEGTNVTLRICDPNYPRATDVTIGFDTADPNGSLTPSWSRQDDQLQCFFHYPWVAADPTPWPG
ncbi:MAG TPA: hypothetical protein VGJ71_06845 [Candidatus Limnocylindrales bacterium]|jgi:hypothetical protein